MLFSSIKNASHNDISSERFQRALAWLATTDMSAIECGRHDIVGEGRKAEASAEGQLC